MGRIFSGIQPTGGVHVGNYVGAIQNWVRMQDEMESFFCIVDYHAMTVPYDPSDFRRRVREAAAINLAAGLDPAKTTLFVQSHVPEHAELAWILGCVTPLGELQRMTQFKDKARQHAENVNAGLLNYPILMAADILIYKADTVPVGEDQVQHLELAREIARRFNGTFGPTFPEPQPRLTAGARIMALTDPESKMSKSVPGSYVALTDPPDEIRRRLRRAVTDTGPTTGEMSPGVRNLFTLLEVFDAQGDTFRALRRAYDEGTLRYVELKDAVAEHMIEQLRPIRERYEELVAHPDRLRTILAEGADRARRVARTTMEEVYERTGLRSRA
ncbi:tryptophan--tRNA ligase [Limnochorda pilosa]|uniref:Tryptophan--tRNA ligase n=1 Tax=Limnochorda pilosa TaxID=1555112 RepID=A0A0K2SG38_LIMPI|nr:tryptophan--tRNA ligase [Limnochorda pilosa]BAS26066.1 tryptophanyl-tRNA synthetase [Limnochorda pilosa]